MFAISVVEVLVEVLEKAQRFLGQGKLKVL
jgi:hypothetical protein